MAARIRAASPPMRVALVRRAPAASRRMALACSWMSTRSTSTATVSAPDGGQEPSQLGFPPCSAVLTEGDSAIVRAMWLGVVGAAPLPPRAPPRSATPPPRPGPRGRARPGERVPQRVVVTAGQAARRARRWPDTTATSSWSKPSPSTVMRLRLAHRFAQGPAAAKRCRRPYAEPSAMPAPLATQPTRAVWPPGGVDGDLLRRRVPGPRWRGRPRRLRFGRRFPWGAPGRPCPPRRR